MAFISIVRDGCSVQFLSYGIKPAIAVTLLIVVLLTSTQPPTHISRCVYVRAKLRWHRIVGPVMHHDI